MRDQTRNANISGAEKEAEATLVVVSDKPEEVSNAIAGLKAVGRYRLVRVRSRAIRDIHWDTPARSLAARRFGLRIRQIGQERLVTLKGPSTPTSWGGRDRLEIEQLFSAETLLGILDVLKGHGIELPAAPGRTVPADPARALSGLGLEVIQERRTRRRPRLVFPIEVRGGPALAELAVDSVTYRLGPREARHWELEIELKCPGGHAAAGGMIRGLLELYGEALRPWPWGKLATGLALEDLIRREAPEEILDAGGRITPAAYDRIASELEMN